MIILQILFLISIIYNLNDTCKEDMLKKDNNRTLKALKI